MHGDHHRRQLVGRLLVRGLLVCGLLTGGLTAGCVNLITNDDALVDEFAEFKANGGQCTGGGGPVASETDYADATSYRWLGYGGALGEVVSDRGRVYYEELLDDPELLSQLRTTVGDIATFNPRNLATHDDKLAFWLNAYNALVMLAAADAFGADPAFRVDQDGFSFFDLRAHTIAGELFSLNEIEHGVIRGTALHPSTAFLEQEAQDFLFGLHDDLWAGAALEPRFHFAINCASSSCPELVPFQFRGETLQADLDTLTTDFLNDPAKGAGPDGISQLFDFYFDDFDAAGGAEAFVGEFRDTEDINFFAYLPYDWSLNIETEAPATQE